MGISEEMQIRKDYLVSVLKKCEKSLKRAPEGRLKVYMRNGNPYYALRSNYTDLKSTETLQESQKTNIKSVETLQESQKANTKSSESPSDSHQSKLKSNKTIQPQLSKPSSKYIRKKDLSVARKIAQRDYDKSVAKSIRQEISAMEFYEKKAPEKSFEEIFEKLNPGRKLLIMPHFVSDDEYQKQWEEQEYTPKGFSATDPYHFTKKGERVRSKSEVIIADMLNDLNISYKYECPVDLKNRVVHPDFTILKMPERKIYYWEHFGKMGDIDYVKRNMKKVLDYEEVGIIPGKNLIFTMESEDIPLNKNQIRRIIYHFLCKNDFKIL